MNLMNLRFQFVVCNLFIFRLFLDQGLNIFIQAYYNDIGKEKAFHIRENDFDGFIRQL